MLDTTNFPAKLDKAHAILQTNISIFPVRIAEVMAILIGLDHPERALKAAQNEQEEIAACMMSKSRPNI